MPTRSSEDHNAGPMRELGLPGRAVTALARAGVRSIEELAVLTRQDLAAIGGLGPGLIAAIRGVVPEPAADGPGRRSTPPVGTAGPVTTVDDPPRETAERESPAAPAVPSFESLRAPRRRIALDLLMPAAPPEQTSSEQTSSEQTSSEQTSPERTLPEQTPPVEVAPVKVAPMEVASVAPVEVASVKVAPVTVLPRSSPPRSSPLRPSPPRPPEYADLFALGAHVMRAALLTSFELARWSICAPAYSLRRLLGDVPRH